MSSVAMKSLLPPPEHVLAGCCLPRIDGKPALMPPPEAPKANFIEQSVEKLKAVGVATADGAAFVGKKSLEGAKAVGDGAKAVGDGVSNLVVTGLDKTLKKVGVTAGLQAVFGEDAKMEASSVVAGAPRRSELDAAVAKVAAYEHYMLCTEGATDEFSELLRSSLGVTQRQHQILARLLLHTEGCPVPMRRDTVQRWLPAYRAIVLIQASALSADSVSSSFLARQRLLLVLALDGTEGSASVANTIDLYAARLLESHTERAQDDAPLPIDFIAPIDAATVATTAAADTGGNEWQMAIWDTLTVTKALEDPWPSPLAFRLYAELVRAVALEPLLEPALSRTAEGGAVEGPGGGGGGGGHGGQWYGWRPATNEAQSRALPALHRVWPSLRLDARTHALAHLHVLLTSFDARVHALRTFSEVQPLETAWQEQLNTALSAAVWAELTHTSSADEDAEADARAAHAVAAKARFDHLVPRCATLGDSGVAAATLIQRTAREVALTRRLREYERRPRHPWRAADRLASTSAALAAELAEVLRDFRYLGGCSGRVELPRLVGTWRLAALTAIVLNRAGPTERAAALQHLQSILTPGAKSDARPAPRQPRCGSCWGAANARSRRSRQRSSRALSRATWNGCVRSATQCPMRRSRPWPRDRRALCRARPPPLRRHTRRHLSRPIIRPSVTSLSSRSIKSRPSGRPQLMAPRPSGRPQLMAPRPSGRPLLMAPRPSGRPLWMAPRPSGRPLWMAPRPSGRPHGMQPPRRPRATKKLSPRLSLWVRA